MKASAKSREKCCELACVRLLCHTGTAPYESSEMKSLAGRRRANKHKNIPVSYGVCFPAFFVFCRDACNAQKPTRLRMAPFLKGIYDKRKTLLYDRSRRAWLSLRKSCFHCHCVTFLVLSFPFWRHRFRAFTLCLHLCTRKSATLLLKLLAKTAFAAPATPHKSKKRVTAVYLLSHRNELAVLFHIEFERFWRAIRLLRESLQNCILCGLQNRQGNYFLHWKQSAAKHRRQSCGHSSLSRGSCKSIENLSEMKRLGIFHYLLRSEKRRY